MASKRTITKALEPYIQGTFAVDKLGPRRFRVFIPASTSHSTMLPPNIGDAKIVYKRGEVGGRSKSRTTGSFPQFQAQSYGPAPSVLEQMVLRIIQRMLSGWFSTSRAKILWDTTLGRNVIAIPMDRASYLRLPKEYMGVPIRHYTVNPALARRSATILQGVPMLAVNDGVGIGWPVITTNWQGGVGPYCIENVEGSMAGMMPSYVATKPGCVCQH